MTKKLLIDITIPNTNNMVKEGLNDITKPLIVSGIIQRADVKNQNGRIYPYDILKREADKYYNEKVKENRAIGELDHPDSTIISLERGSHIITDLWWDGKDLYGKIKVLSDIYDKDGRLITKGTVNGNILRAYFDHGVVVGISSRGLGSVQKANNGDIVKNDFELLCWDIVSEPSTKGAFITPVKENLIKEVKYLNEDNQNLYKIETILDSLLEQLSVKCDENKCFYF